MQRVRDTNPLLVSHTCLLGDPGYLTWDGNRDGDGGWFWHKDITGPPQGLDSCITPHLANVFSCGASIRSDNSGTQA